MANFVEQDRKQPDDGGHGVIMTLPDTSGHATVVGYYGLVLGAGLGTDLFVRWYSCTPWEVELEFHDHNKNLVVPWLVGRQLLREGGGQVDMGDLVVFRDKAMGRVGLMMRSPNGHGSVCLDAEWIDELLARTDVLVAPEHEFDDDVLFASWPFDIPFLVAAPNRPRGSRDGDPGPAWPTDEPQSDAEPPCERQ